MAVNDYIAIASGILVIILTWIKITKPTLTRADVKTSLEILEKLDKASVEYKRVQSRIEREIDYLYPSRESAREKERRSQKYVNAILAISLGVLGLYLHSQSSVWKWVVLVFFAGAVLECFEKAEIDGSEEQACENVKSPEGLKQERSKNDDAQ